MTMQHVILVLGLTSAFWAVGTAVCLYEALRRRGERVSFIWLRVMIPSYLNRYRAITRAESGRTGPLFHSWIVSINLALVFFIIFALTR
jgi:hypothetical protein